MTVHSLRDDAFWITSGGLPAAGEESQYKDSDFVLCSLICSTLPPPQSLTMGRVRTSLPCVRSTGRQPVFLEMSSVMQVADKAEISFVYFV